MSSDDPTPNSSTLNAADPAEASSDGMAKKPYEPPRIEKRRSVARVTLLSGGGQAGVGTVGGGGGGGLRRGRM